MYPPPPIENCIRDPRTSHPPRFDVAFVDLGCRIRREALIDPCNFLARRAQVECDVLRAARRAWPPRPRRPGRAPRPGRPAPRAERLDLGALGALRRAPARRLLGVAAPWARASPWAPGASPRGASRLASWGSASAPRGAWGLAQGAQGDAVAQGAPRVARGSAPQDRASWGRALGSRVHALALGARLAR